MIPYKRSYRCRDLGEILIYNFGVTQILTTHEQALSNKPEPQPSQPPRQVQEVSHSGAPRLQGGRLRKELALAGCWYQVCAG